MKREHYQLPTFATAGYKIWAFAFTYANDKTNKAYYQTPILGELHVTNQPRPDGSIPSIGPLSYFVPYQKNKTKLAWSRAVRIESRNYADTKEEAEAAYAQRVNQMQNWHYLTGIMTGELYDLPEDQQPVMTPTFDMIAMDWEKLADAIRTQRVNANTECYLAIGPNKCLRTPIKFNDDMSAITIRHITKTQHIELRLNLEDIGPILDYRFNMEWDESSGTTLLYRKL